MDHVPIIFGFLHRLLFSDIHTCNLTTELSRVRAIPVRLERLYDDSIFTERRQITVVARRLQRPC